MGTALRRRLDRSGPLILRTLSVLPIRSPLGSQDSNRRSPEWPGCRRSAPRTALLSAADRKLVSANQFCASTLAGSGSAAQRACRLYGSSGWWSFYRWRRTPASWGYRPTSWMYHGLVATYHQAVCLHGGGTLLDRPCLVQSSLCFLSSSVNLVFLTLLLLCDESARFPISSSWFRQRYILSRASSISLRLLLVLFPPWNPWLLRWLPSEGSWSSKYQPSYAGGFWPWSLWSHAPALLL